jgi:hypothetical protein
MPPYTRKGHHTSSTAVRKLRSRPRAGASTDTGAPSTPSTCSREGATIGAAAAALSTQVKITRGEGPNQHSIGHDLQSPVHRSTKVSVRKHRQAKAHRTCLLSSSATLDKMIRHWPAPIQADSPTGPPLSLPQVSSANCGCKQFKHSLSTRTKHDTTRCIHISETSNTA